MGETPELAPRDPMPLACTLGPADGSTRLLRWQHLHETAAPVAQLRDGELEVRYQPVTGVHEGLTDLAAAEKACCSFVTWSVTMIDSQPVLRVTAPPEAPDAVKPIAVMFTAAGSSRRPPQ